MSKPLGTSRKTPIFSPDLDSETCPVSRSGIVRESLMISRFFDIYSKPGLCPESQYSPRNPARQQIFSKKEEGGVLAIAPRGARVVFWGRSYSNVPGFKDILYRDFSIVRSSAFFTSSPIASSIRYLPGTVGSTPSSRSLSAVTGPTAPTTGDLSNLMSFDIGISRSAMPNRLDAEAALVNRTAWNCPFLRPARKFKTLSLFAGTSD